jgi:hypothetical protein
MLPMLLVVLVRRCPLLASSSAWLCTTAAAAGKPAVLIELTLEATYRRQTYNQQTNNQETGS